MNEGVVVLIPLARVRQEPEPLFDAYVALTAAGALLMRAKAAKRRLKRFVKTNPKLWTLVARMRKALG